MAKKTGKFDIDKAEKFAGKQLLDSGKDITKQNTTLVEETRQQSIQERAKRPPEGPLTTSSLADQINHQISFLFQSADVLPVWWSTRRDLALSAFWKSVNLLSGAMYTMTSKMTTIPFHIEPRDMAITSHFKEATRFEKKLMESSEFGNGWGQFFSKQVQSLLGQDNGRFMEILDMSSYKSGPLVGPALSIAHLDPSRCMRTHDPMYPVIYTDRGGSFHKMHFTRVAFQAQLPSERVEMLGIGLCAVSRSSSYARNLLDMSQYKEEKLGSRPMRGFITVGGGLEADAVGEALAVANEMSDNAGLGRFGRLPIIGSADIEDPTITLTSLSSIPDGFTELESTDIAMAAIALAFGVDARELWPSSQKGATRADALLSHIKQRGKGPGQILIETERMFNQWFLPPFLKMVFDFQDDAQDRQRAEISKERSLTREKDINLGVTSERTERETMVKDGEISSAQFKNLEMEDGRLPDGTPLETVFFRDASIYEEILSLPGFSNPLDIRANDPEKILDAISAQIPIAMAILAKEKRQIEQRQARESLAALQNLAEQYEETLAIQEAEELAAQEEANKPIPSENRQGNRQGAKSNAESESAVTAQSNSEQNLTNQELSPRELKTLKKGNADMNIIEKVRRIIQRPVDSPEQMLLKGMELYLLENIPDAIPPVIQVEVTPNILIQMPEQKSAPILVNVEASKQPEIHIDIPPQKDIIVNIPEQKPPIINVESTVPQIIKGTNSEKETITFERDEQTGEITKAHRTTRNSEE